MFFKPKKKQEEENKHFVEPQKADFIVVYHFWFVDSKGFEETHHTGLTRDEVFKEALIYKHKHEDTFRKCDFTIIELKE